MDRQQINLINTNNSRGEIKKEHTEEQATDLTLMMVNCMPKESAKGWIALSYE